MGDSGQFSDTLETQYLYYCLEAFAFGPYCGRRIRDRDDEALPSSHSIDLTYSLQNQEFRLSLSSHPNIIRRETSRLTIEFAVPPIVRTLSLLDDADTIAVSERQISIRLAVKVEQRSDVLRLLDARESLCGDRWWRLLLFGRDACRADRRRGRGAARFLLLLGEVVRSGEAGERSSAVRGWSGASVGLIGTAGVGIVGNHG